MTIFKEYEIVCNTEFELRNKITTLVEKYINDHVGIVNENDIGDTSIIDKTTKSEISWSLNSDHTISIFYSPIANRYMDYWDEDKEIKITQNELLKYESEGN